jgi:hypothetical protein
MIPVALKPMPLRISYSTPRNCVPAQCLSLAVIPQQLPRSLPWLQRRWKSPRCRRGSSSPSIRLLIKSSLLLPRLPPDPPFDCLSSPYHLSLSLGQANNLPRGRQASVTTRSRGGVNTDTDVTDRWHWREPVIIHAWKMSLDHDVHRQADRGCHSVAS